MIMSGGHSGCGSASAQTWYLDPASRRKALTKTGWFHNYVPGLVSQATFEDEYFREMLQAYYEAAAGEKVGTAPLMTVEAVLLSVK